MEDLAKHHLNKIAETLRAPKERVTECCQEIIALNPKPGNYFNSRETLRYISPDAIVVLLENELQILVNEYQYPSFQINPYYKKLSETTTDKETKRYLQEKLKQIKDISEGIQLRTSMLSRVMNVLVKRQSRFFLTGPGNKVPMQLADIAQETGLSLSTISRTLRSKYLQCTWGVYPLKYFLTSAVEASDGQVQTPEALKAAIQTIIEKEDKKKPYSDEGIRKKLQEDGIQLARRTINKYRTELGIPDRSGRKI